MQGESISLGKSAYTLGALLTQNLLAQDPRSYILTFHEILGYCFLHKATLKS